MRTRTLFSILIAGIIFSSCTTTLQQRRVADELYENPDTYTSEQEARPEQDKDQAAKEKDTLSRYDRYGYRPHYGPGYGYIPHRWYHHYRPDWYYWDFYPYYPYYGYGYPWYGAAFFGYHSYWYSPYYRNYPYFPSYYSWSSTVRQRKTTSNRLYNERNRNITVPQTGRIRKVLSSPENKSLIRPKLSTSSDRKGSVPLRTIRATDRNRAPNSGSVTTSGKRINYIRPSNIKGSQNRKYTPLIRNSGVRNSVRPAIRKSSPVYRSPVRPVNRVQQITPAISAGNRK
ncbi:MAG: hypothetical protein ACOCTU_04550 [Bacteroidota bacterium]